jgi:hypothetical protein
MAAPDSGLHGRFLIGIPRLRRQLRPANATAHFGAVWAAFQMQ